MTRERIEELFKSGAITFQEAIDLGGTIEDTVEPIHKAVVTKKEVFDDFIDHLLDPETVEEDGKMVTYDFMDIEEIEDSLARRRVEWQGKAVTTDMIHDEIKSLVRECVTDLIKKVESGEYSIDDNNLYSRVSGTCFIVESYFSEDCKKIEVKVYFSPDSGYGILDYQKYCMAK